MRTDNILRVDAMDSLIKTLGLVEAERFVFLIKRDSFDYTEWQRTLWDDKSYDEIFNHAKAREEERRKNGQLPPCAYKQV